MLPGSYLTIKEVAARLDVSPTTVRDWVISGRLQAYNWGGSSRRALYRIPLPAFEKFLGFAVESFSEVQKRFANAATKSAIKRSAVALVSKSVKKR